MLSLILAFAFAQTEPLDGCVANGDTEMRCGPVLVRVFDVSEHDWFALLTKGDPSAEDDLSFMLTPEKLDWRMNTVFGQILTDRKFSFWNTGTIRDGELSVSSWRMKAWAAPSTEPKRQEGWVALQAVDGASSAICFAPSGANAWADRAEPESKSEIKQENRAALDRCRSIVLHIATGKAAQDGATGSATE